MKAGELKRILDAVDPDLEVGIAVETPFGYLCPDGCLVEVSRARQGIDWHNGDFVIVPKCRLRLTPKGLEDWRNRRESE